MCGITGKLYFSKNKVSRLLIERMNRKIAHRGPDDEGIYIEKNIGLGHRRLSIIDLSSAGHQPMFNEDGSIAIVYNGEIYNFLDLKPELEKKGHKFRSSTDTEVIIHLYEEYGENCLKYLRGAFAFAIWDKNKQKLLLARDRMGKKPLKYCLTDKFIIFASELKSILVDTEVKKEPDFQAIYHYLSFQYVPAPLTGFKNIKKLPPAHYLICKDGKVKIKKYWNLDFSKKENLSEEEWTQRIIEKLKECVEIRMISDVPLGALLSGGVDSATIVALMSLASKKPVKTFSIGFKEDAFNELPYARTVAQKYKTDHTEFIVEPSAAEILPKLVYSYEEPYADSSALPTYYVSEIAKKYVTVALNGDGGDENFGGYTAYNAWLLANKIPFSVKKIMQRFSFLGGMISDPTWRQRFYVLLDAFDKQGLNMYFDFFSSTYFTEREKQNLLTKEFKANLNESSYDKAAEYFDTGLDLLDQVVSFGINTYLPEDLLAKVDIASMANGLEGRSPLLDHEFFELTAKIPASLKIHAGSNKYIFKKTVRDLLPVEILTKRKQGFSIPIDKWFREGKLCQMAKEIVLTQKAFERNIFQEQEIRRLFNEHKSGRYNHGSRIWALLWLELWFQTFFD